MAKIGYLNKLKVISQSTSQTLLDGENLGQIALSEGNTPREAYRPGDILETFVFADQNGSLVATTKNPIAVPGQFALLKVKAQTAAGALLDWGLHPDLLAPANEQRPEMQVGKLYIVFLYLHGETKQILASSMLDKFLDTFPPTFTAGEKVDLLICTKTDLGYKAIINNSHWGLLYQNEIFRPLVIGQQTKGFIKKVREDARIDLYLDAPGSNKVDELANQIISYLNEQGGSMPVTDKSPADIIYKSFGASKKTFKKALGALYKRKLILIDNNSVSLIN